MPYDLVVKALSYGQSQLRLEMARIDFDKLAEKLNETSNFYVKGVQVRNKDGHCVLRTKSLNVSKNNIPDVRTVVYFPEYVDGKSGVPQLNYLEQACDAIDVLYNGDCFKLPEVLDNLRVGIVSTKIELKQELELKQTMQQEQRPLAIMSMMLRGAYWARHSKILKTSSKDLPKMIKDEFGEAVEYY